MKERERPRRRQDDDGRSREPEHPQPGSSPQRPRSDEYDGREQDERRVGRLEVSGERHEAPAVDRENADGQHEGQNRSRISDAEETVGPVDDSRDRRNPEREPEPPEEDVLQRKEVVRVACPLDERWVTGVAAGQGALLTQDVEKPCVQADVPDVRAREGVRLRDSKDGESDRSAADEPEDALTQQGSDPPSGSAPASRRDHPDHDGRKGQHHQRQCGHLAREPEPDCRAAEEIAGRAARAGDPDREVERRRAEEGQVWIDRPEVSELDLKHGER